MLQTVLHLSLHFGSRVPFILLLCVENRSRACLWLVEFVFLSSKLLICRRLQVFQNNRRYSNQDRQCWRNGTIWLQLCWWWYRRDGWHIVLSSALCTIDKPRVRLRRSRPSLQSLPYCIHQVVTSCLSRVCCGLGCENRERHLPDRFCDLLSRHERS